MLVKTTCGLAVPWSFRWELGCWKRRAGSSGKMFRFAHVGMKGELRATWTCEADHGELAWASRFPQVQLHRCA